MCIICSRMGHSLVIQHVFISYQFVCVDVGTWHHYCQHVWMCAGLPTSPVDVIVSALDGDGVDLSHEAWYQSVVHWASDNKAPVLCLDPPCGNVSVAAKWSLAVALPLAYSDRCGQIYLCDLGLPARLYRDAGLQTYKSPFAHKFVIPLHLPWRVQSTVVLEHCDINHTGLSAGHTGLSTNRQLFTEPQWSLTRKT